MNSSIKERFQPHKWIWRHFRNKMVSLRPEFGLKYFDDFFKPNRPGEYNVSCTLIETLSTLFSLLLSKEKSVHLCIFRHGITLIRIDENFFSKSYIILHLTVYRYVIFQAYVFKHFRKISMINYQISLVDKICRALRWQFSWQM